MLRLASGTAQTGLHSHPIEQGSKRCGGRHRHELSTIRFLPSTAGADRELMATDPLFLNRRSPAPRWLLSAVDQAAASGINFLVAFVGARALPVDDYAVFSLVLLVLLFLTGVHQALLLTPLPVLHPERDDIAGRHYVASIRRLNHIWCGSLLSLGLLGAWIWPSWAPLLIVACLTQALRSTADLERRLAYCLDRIDRAALAGSLQALVLLGYAAGLLLGWVPADDTMLLGALGFAAGLSAVWARFLQRGIALPADWSMARNDALHHWRFGGWVLGATLAMWCSSQSYPFFIAQLLPLREVALFGAAKTVLGLCHFAMQGIDIYAVPVLRQELLNSPWDRFVARCRRTLGSGAGVLVAGCLLIAILPDTLLRLFYGDKYLDGATILRVLALIYLLTTLNRMLQILLTAMKEPRAGFNANMVNAVLTITAAPFLVRHFGMLGVLLAFALNQTIATATYTLYARRTWRRWRNQRTA